MWDKNVEIDRGYPEGKVTFRGVWGERGYVNEDTGEKLQPSYAAGYLEDQHGNIVKDPDY